MARKKIEKAPYDTNGSLKSYPGYGDVLEPVREFFGTLKVEGIERGRSAAHFQFVDDSTGLRYPMFMADLMDIMNSGKVITGGRVTDWWTVSKRGANYGIRAMTPEEVREKEKGQ